MILAFDIGNTHIVTGIIENGKVIMNFRVATAHNITEDELFSYIKNGCDWNNIDLKNISGVIVSSVVPNLITICQRLSNKYFDMTCKVVNLDLNIPFTFAKGLNNHGFGADRIIDITQGLELFPDKDLLIFDLGTATTYEILIDKVYVGGGILPGINMAINSLFGNTAQLPKVSFEKPSTVAGRNTVEQIQSGIFFGYRGQIKEIIKEVKKIYPDIYVIATGGLGEVISNEVEEIDRYFSGLSLEGLYTLFMNNR